MSVPIINFDTSGWSRAVNRLLARVKNPEPFLRILAEILFRRAGKSFEGEREPSGIPWKPLSPAYAFWKKTIAKKGAQGILRLRGTLFRSLDRGFAADRAFVTARAKHARVHQEGHTFPPMIVKPTKKKALRFFTASGVAVFSKGHKIGQRVVPARPFMGFPFEDRRQAAVDIENSMLEAFEGA